MTSATPTFHQALSSQKLRAHLASPKPCWAVHAETGVVVYANAAAAKAFGYASVSDLLAAPLLGLSGERTAGGYSPRTLSSPILQMRLYRGLKSITLIAAVQKLTLDSGSALFVMETEAGTRKAPFTGAELSGYLQGLTSFSVIYVNGDRSQFGDDPVDEEAPLTLANGDRLFFAAAASTQREPQQQDTPTSGTPTSDAITTETEAASQQVANAAMEDDVGTENVPNSITAETGDGAWIIPYKPPSDPLSDTLSENQDSQSQQSEPETPVADVFTPDVAEAFTPAAPILNDSDGGLPPSPDVWSSTPETEAQDNASLHSLAPQETETTSGPAWESDWQPLNPDVGAEVGDVTPFIDQIDTQRDQDTAASSPQDDVLQGDVFQDTPSATQQPATPVTEPSTLDWLDGVSSSSDHEQHGSPAPDGPGDVIADQQESVVADESANQGVSGIDTGTADLADDTSDTVETPNEHQAESPSIEVMQTSIAEGSATPPDPEFEFKRRPIPDRFVWQSDDTGHVLSVSEELALAVGSGSATIIGRNIADLIDARGGDETTVRRALEASRAFSGIEVNWPVDNSDVLVPVILAGTPLVARNGAVSYRGFGVCKTIDGFYPNGSDDAEEIETASTGLRPSPGQPKPLSRALAPSFGDTNSTSDAPSLEGQHGAKSDSQPGDGDQAAPHASSKNPDLETPGGTLGGLLSAASVLASAAVAKLAWGREREETQLADETANVAGDAIETAGIDEADIEQDQAAPLHQEGSNDADAAQAAAPQDGDKSADNATHTAPGAAPGASGTSVEDASNQAAAAAAAAGLAAAISDHKSPSSKLADEITNEIPNPAKLQSETKGSAEGSPDRKSPHVDLDIVEIQALLTEDPRDATALEDDLPDEAQSTDPEKWAEDELAETNNEPIDIDPDLDDGSQGTETISRNFLTKPEEDAFRQIAKELGARFEGDIDQPLPPQPDLHLADDGQFDFIQPPLPVPAGEPRKTTPSVALDSASIRRVIDKLPIGVLISQSDDIVVVNQAFLDLSGFSSLDEIKVRGGLGALFAEPDAVDAQTALIRARAGTDEPAVRLVRADGVEIPVDVHLNTLPWKTDTTDGAKQNKTDSLALMMSFAALAPQPNTQAANEDLTSLSPTSMPHADDAEQLRLQTHLEEMDAVLNTATDGVLMLATDGTILSVNKAAEALFGASQEAMTGQALADYVDEGDRINLAAYIAKFSADSVASLLNDGLEVLGRTPSGGTLPIFVTIGRLGTEPTTKLCAVLRDITQWKAVEKDLRHARIAAENASAQKSDFLARISHEIRTPLNAIIGFSEVLMDDRLAALSSERRREYLRDIHASGSHIMSLVNDLLDLAKIEAGRMDVTFREVNVAALVKQCVSMVQAQAIRDKIIMRTFVPDGLPSIVADEKSLKQILLNLLSNAVKFNLPGGQVIISAVTEDNGDFVLRVKDTGVGIAEKDIPLAMEPFRRLSSTSNTSGSGLGLPLTKALVEVNRATFGLESEVNQGTVAEVRFPKARVTVSS